MKLRLDKILTSQGLCSRKEAGVAIKRGRVLFNGEVLTTPKDKIETEGLRITFAGADYLYSEFVYIMLYKQVGYECSDAPRLYPPVSDLLDPLHRNRGVMSAGRLDVDTTGLLLFSDDGQFIHRVAAPKKHLPKEYCATLKRPLEHSMAQQLLRGVRLDNDSRPAKALEVAGVETTEVRISIDEGRYHQVKRMFAAVGTAVVALHRRRIGALVLPEDMSPGSWRYMSDADHKKLFGALP